MMGFMENVAFLAGIGVGLGILFGGIVLGVCAGFKLGFWLLDINIK